MAGIGTWLRDRLNAVSTRTWVFLGAIVFVWAVLYLTSIGDLSIRVWDESRYVSPARDMAQGAGWLIPEIRLDTFETDLTYSTRLAKPALLYWLQALSMSVFGISEFGARLPSALATLGCALLVYHIATHIGTDRAGVAAGISFLVFPGMLLGSHGGTAAVPDPLLAFVGSSFVWLTWLARDRPQLLVPAGVFAGLAVMTKGIAAGVFVIVLAPIVLWQYRSYLTGWTLAGIGATLVVALPWHLYAYLTHPETFLNHYVERAVSSRIAGEMAPPPVDPLVPFFNYPYLRQGIEAVLPPWPYALPVFAVGVVLGLGLIIGRLRRDGWRHHRTELMLLWWIVAVPLTFAIGGGNHPWYLMPMYLPGAVLMGLAIASLADGTVARALETRRIVGKLVDGVRTVLPDPTTVDERVWTVGFVVVLVCSAGVLSVAYGPALHPEYNDGQKTIGTALNDAVPPGEPIYIHLGVNHSTRSIMTMEVYADRPMRWTTPAELNNDTSIAYAVVPPETLETMTREYRVIASNDVDELVAIAF